MGQKASSNNTRIKNIGWVYKYHDKNLEESTLYNYQHLQIKSYMKKFLKESGILIHNLKIKYTEKKLFVFVSIFITKKTIGVVKRFHSRNNLQLKRKKSFERKSRAILKPNRPLNIILTKKEKLIKSLDKSSRAFVRSRIKNLTEFRSRFNLDNNAVTSTTGHYNKKIPIFKSKRRKYKDTLHKREGLYKKALMLKIYNNYLLKKNSENTNQLYKNIFFGQLLRSISRFTGKRSVKIICKNISFNKYNLTKTDQKFIKRRVLNALGQYRNRDYFNESVRIALVILTKPSSSELLADFLAFQIGRTKRHIYMVRFIKILFQTLIPTKISKIKGVKISVKGRLNTKFRAKKNTVIIGQCPLQTFKSNISQSESTAYTRYGTYGIKVWVYEENN